MPPDLSLTGPSLVTPVTTKRRASDTFENLQQDNGRKRHREAMDDFPTKSGFSEDLAVDGNAFVEDLAQELRCGCCSALVYRPVVVSPCQHFFCGRYAP
jgi:E3 ubiquitin-protein ligase CHFR